MLSLPNHPLKVLVVGSGGREHVLCWKIAQSPLVEQVFCAPGNGGTAIEKKVKNINIASNYFPDLANFCADGKIDLVVIGPENVLAEGIVDFFQSKGQRIFGPTRNTARLEWSKVYAKEFMQRNGLPTAQFKVCSNYQDALQIIKDNSWARVIKVDGLASGKGVFVCKDEAETEQALKEIFEQKKFGLAGEKVILESTLNGEEISLFLLCDGKTFLPMAPSQDNKRRFDNDRGPNTGGMGAISPPASYKKYETLIEQIIIQPLLAGLRKESINYQGVLYVGLLLDRDSQTGAIAPKILEFNSRFGDPETEAVLPRLKSDLLPALWACTEGKLDEITLEWTNEACCCVVAVNKDYPAKSSHGDTITFNTNGNPDNQVTMFHAGTKLANEQLVTNGGRILVATALAPDLHSAASRIYDYLPEIHFKDMDYRRDIAQDKDQLASRT